MELLELDVQELITELEKIDPNAKVATLLPMGVSKIFGLHDEVEKEKTFLSLINEWSVQKNKKLSKHTNVYSVSELIKELEKKKMESKVYTVLPSYISKIYGVYVQRKLGGEKIAHIVNDLDVKTKSDAYRYLIMDLSDYNNE